MKTELKFITFIWDEEHKELLIERDGFTFAIPKRYMFSLNRFLLRVFQRGFYRKRK